MKATPRDWLHFIELRSANGTQKEHQEVARECAKVIAEVFEMNERIKELSGKALDKAVPYTWTKLDYEQIQELLACHAELIVRECIAVVDRDDGATHHSELLLEHFGVEE